MNQGTTRLVTIELTAMTRVQYSASVSVPVDATDEEIDELVNAMYARTDGSDFVDDPDYWERGNCYASPAVDEPRADFQYSRCVDGAMVLEPMTMKHIIADIKSRTLAPQSANAPHATA